MGLLIKRSDLPKIEELSSYNDNYYRLDIPINDCDILHGESDDTEYTVWTLGRLDEDGDFEIIGYVGVSDNFGEEYIDLMEYKSVSDMWD